MPFLAAIPAVVGASLIGGGAAVGAGLLAKKASDNATKSTQKTLSPLIQSQADASKWSLDQAKTDIPKARETLSGPLAFWNNILSGNRQAAMSAIGPTADQQAAQVAAANRSQTEYASRGGRRTLMLGEQPLSTVTNMNQNLLSLRTTAADKATSIGQILAQLGLGEDSAATSAGSSAISGALGQANLANQAAANSADITKGLGTGIGALLKLLLSNNKSSPASPSIPAIPGSVLAGPDYSGMNLGFDPTGGR